MVTFVGYLNVVSFCLIMVVMSILKLANTISLLDPLLMIHRVHGRFRHRLPKVRRRHFTTRKGALKSRRRSKMGSRHDRFGLPF